MAIDLSAPWQPPNSTSLAKQFSRFGWIGFWIQMVLLIKPILLLIYVLFKSSPDSVQQEGLHLSHYLSHGSLVVMLFTTFWCFRYTRIGRRLDDSKLRPSLSVVMKTLWIGLCTSCLGILFSMMLLISEVGRLFFILLTIPQTTIQLVPVQGIDPTRTLSIFDAARLSSPLLMLSAELIVLGFTLWLLFRVVHPPTETSKSTNLELNVDVNAS